MSDLEPSLELPSLLEEAHARANGLEDLGDGPFIEPLERFVDSLEQEARLNPIGRIIARGPDDA